MPKTILIGNFGAGNLGDEAILAGFLRKFPHNNYLVLSARPRETSDLHQVESMKHFPSGPRSFFLSLFSLDLWKIIREFKNCKKVIFPGGGLFCDPSKGIFVWSMQFLMALILKKEIFLRGQSFGPISSNKMKKLTAFLLSKAKEIEVRDPISKEFLENLFKNYSSPTPQPLSPVQVKLGLDSAFFLEKEKKSVSQKHKKIVICLKEGLFKSGMDKKFAQNIEKLSLEIIFLEMQRNNGDEKGDQLEHKKVIHYLSPEIKYKLFSPKSPQEVIKILSRSDGVVSSRLHGIILASVVNKPFLAISYAPKVDGILETLGKKPFSYEEISYKLLRETFNLKICKKK